MHLKVPAQIDPNIGDPVQREHPQNRVELGCGHEHKKISNIFKTVQYRIIGPRLLMTD